MKTIIKTIALALASLAMFGGAAAQADASTYLSISAGKAKANRITAQMARNTDAYDWDVSRCFKFNSRTVSCVQSFDYDDGGWCVNTIRINKQRDGYLCRCSRRSLTASRRNPLRRVRESCPPRAMSQGTNHHPPRSSR